MNATGKRFSHQKIVGDYVENYPGLTAAEIGDISGLGQHEASRRLPELVGIRVQRGVQRKCKIKGSMMVTWWPV